VPANQLSNLLVLVIRGDSRVIIVMSSCGRYQTQFRQADGDAWMASWRMAISTSE